MVSLQGESISGESCSYKTLYETRALCASPILKLPSLPLTPDGLALDTSSFPLITDS